MAEMKLVFDALYHLRTEARRGNINPQSLVSFSNELETTLKVIGSAATEAYNMAEKK